MLYAGKPQYEDIRAFEENQTLAKFALESLRPGHSINKFCNNIKQKADSLNISLLEGAGFGHGVGLSEMEWPILTADNTSNFEKGMAICVDIKTFGPHGVIIHSTNTYAIIEDGYRNLSDFRDWDHLYCIDGCRANH